LDDTKMLIQKMLEDGDYQSPEPYMDLSYSVILTQSAYLRAKMKNAPEERLQLLRQFMDECKILMDEAQVQQAPQPIAEPEAPPVSDLLPAVA